MLTTEPASVGQKLHALRIVNLIELFTLHVLVKLWCDVLRPSVAEEDDDDDDIFKEFDVDLDFQDASQAATTPVTAPGELHIIHLISQKLGVGFLWEPQPHITAI